MKIKQLHPNGSSTFEYATCVAEYLMCEFLRFTVWNPPGPTVCPVDLSLLMERVSWNDPAHVMRSIPFVSRFPAFIHSLLRPLGTLAASQIVKRGPKTQLLPLLSLLNLDSGSGIRNIC